MENLLTTVFSVLALAALLYRITVQARKTAKQVKGEVASRKERSSVLESAPASTAAPQIPNFASDASASPRPIRSAQTAETTSAPHIEADKLPTGAFDLRAAILYSEILKPKFDE